MTKGLPGSASLVLLLPNSCHQLSAPPRYLTFQGAFRQRQKNCSKEAKIPACCVHTAERVALQVIQCALQAVTEAGQGSQMLPPQPCVSNLMPCEVGSEGRSFRAQVSACLIWVVSTAWSALQT